MPKADEGLISHHYILYDIIVTMNRLYKKQSLKNAKELRKNQTDCENILWYNIRNRRLKNIKFRRQVPIGQYIVDFATLDKKLIVELDGSQHITTNKEYDDKRTEFLNNQGYKVLRFLDNDVINNLENVLILIADEYDNL